MGHRSNRMAMSTPREGTQQCKPVPMMGFLDANWSWSAQHQNP
jgi:hypothetical protein